MASSPAQGQEDVAAPTRPAVRRRSLDDLAADPWRSHAVPRHRHQAGPRAARAARRRRHAAVPGHGRLRVDQPDRPRRVRPARRRAPLASRRSARSWSTTSRSACAATAAPTAMAGSAHHLEQLVRRALDRATLRRGRRILDGQRPTDGRRSAPAASAPGPPSARSARSHDPPAGSPAATRAISLGTTRAALHRPGLGDSERRRLGRRRSHFSFRRPIRPGRTR